MPRKFFWHIGHLSVVIWFLQVSQKQCPFAHDWTLPFNSSKQIGHCKISSKSSANFIFKIIRHQRVLKVLNKKLMNNYTVINLEIISPYYEVLELGLTFYNILQINCNVVTYYLIKKIH